MAFKYACIIVLLLSLEIILAQARSAAGKGTIKHRGSISNIISETFTSHFKQFLNIFDSKIGIFLG